MPGTPHQVPYDQQTKTDHEGGFVFEKVPPGSHQLFREINPHESSTGMIGQSHFMTVEVKPGETTQTTIGGDGRKVIGRITVPIKTDRQAKTSPR
jgi:hypothetical protein